MPLTPTVTDLLLTATAKALATTGPQGLNVVPVSTIKIQDGNIILVDYFFNKTRDNLQNSLEVSLVGWTGLTGYQIKAKHTYHTQGSFFDEVVAWIAELHPDRTVIGAVKLTPTEIHDISIG